MNQFVKELPMLILTEKCFKEYLENYNFFHVECFKATLSKCLGTAVIFGSLLVKVPQIVKILESKSIHGINIASVLLDVFAATAAASYSFINQFPFSAWGDSVFVGLQTVIIAFLHMYYSSGLKRATSFLAAYTAIVAAVIVDLAPLEVLWFAQAFNIPIILISRSMQAYTNYLNGSTGQLSAVTAFMLLFGSLARILTSIQETGDATMIIMYVITTLANSIIVFQLIYYWNVSEKKTAAIKKKK